MCTFAAFWKKNSYKIGIFRLLKGLVCDRKNCVCHAKINGSNRCNKQGTKKKLYSKTSQQF